PAFWCFGEEADPTPLLFFFVATPSIGRLKLKAHGGANLHSQTDRTGETALHLAARYARSDAAKRLLEASANANIQDHMGKTPLHAAVSADAQGVFQILIRNRATDLDARMHDGTTPLILAARLGVEGMLEDLISCHADVNAVDDLGQWCLPCTGPQL
uniref:Notch receptor 1 n=1 Tax=Pseudonaja textilis TaxID=8673 RepID=A0A670YQF9_PSETE